MASTTYYNDIQKLYVAYFNRPADVPGLQYWEGVVEANAGSTAAVSATFAASAEYKAITAGQDAYHLVGLIYQNLFGHPADVPGLNYWAQGLIRGDFTVATAVTAIAGGAQGSDLVAYNNKVTAAAAFTGALDTTPEILAYSGAAANAAAVNFLSGITDTPSLNAALVPATLNASVAAVVQIYNNINAQVFSLTNGINTFAGTAGNDTFNAADDATANPTFTTLDSIDGGAGVDTLNITQSAAVANIASTTVKNIEIANVTSAHSINLNTTGWVGLTDLTTSSAIAAAADTITAASTTNITASVGAAGALTVGAQGGNNVVFTANGVTVGGTINVGTAAVAKGTTVVNVNELSSQTTVTADAINVVAGVSAAVNVNLAGATANTITGGAVIVTGTAATTAVSVIQTASAAADAQTSGVVDGAVTINDFNAGSATVAGTISNVILQNSGGAAISSSALANLSLTGKNGTITMTDGLTAPTVKTLNLAVDGLRSTANGVAQLQDLSNKFTTINIKTGLSTTSSKLAITDTVLKTVAISGGAALTMDLSGNSQLTTVTDSSAGTQTLTLGSGVSFDGTGSGKDVITLTGATTGIIKGGSTAGNTLTAAFNGTGVTSLGSVTGFTTLGLNGASSGTFDLGSLTSFNAVEVTASNTVAVINATSGVTLSLDTDEASFSLATADATGAADTATVNLGVASGAGVTVGALVATDNANVAVGTLNIASTYTGTAFGNLITSLDAGTTGGIKNLNVTGNAGLVVAGWTDASASVTITNNSTGSNANGFTLTDNTLASLTLAGSNTAATSISLSDSIATGFTINNSSKGAVTINTIGGFAASSLNVNDSSTAAMTLAAFTDNTLATATLVNTGTALLKASGITSSALATVSLSGTGAETITSLSTSHAGLTVTDTSSAAVTITTLADTGVGALTVNSSGSGLLTVSTLTGTIGASLLTLSNTGTGGMTVAAGTDTATSLALNNTGTGTLKVTAMTDNALTAATFTGSGAINATITDSAAVTISGGTTTGAVTLTLNTAATGSAITLGTGVNTVTVTDGTAADNVSITVGGQVNTITLAAAHTGISAITLTHENAGNVNALTSIANWDGAGSTDTLTFHTAAINTSIHAEGTVTSVAAGLAGLDGTSGFNTFVYNGDMYVYEVTAGTATDQLVVLVGNPAAGIAATSTTIVHS